MHLLRRLCFSERVLLCNILNTRNRPSPGEFTTSSQNASILKPDPGKIVDDRCREPGTADEDEYFRFITKKRFREAVKILREEFQVWKGECRERFKLDPNVLVQPGDFKNQVLIRRFFIILLTIKYFLQAFLKFLFD